MNNILETGIPPLGWKNSKTVLIPKTKMPKVSEFRPIALTNVSYKIFMGVCKNAIVKHMESNCNLEDVQAGFTKDRRLEDNLFLLQYCIGESKSKCKPLIIASVDFSKAFDSVSREKLIRAMMLYKVDESVIDVIAKLYMEDQTDLFY